MEIGTALIVGILVFCVIYFINDQKKQEQRRIENQEKAEESKRWAKRHTLFQILEEDLINESQMDYGEKYHLKHEFEIEEGDFGEAKKQYSRWIWLKLRVFEQCMRQYPEFFDHEHSKVFTDEVREDFEKRFPSVKSKLLEHKIEDWGPND